MSTYSRSLMSRWLRRLASGLFGRRRQPLVRAGRGFILWDRKNHVWQRFNPEGIPDAYSEDYGALLQSAPYPI